MTAKIEIIKPAIKLKPQQGGSQTLSAKMITNVSSAMLLTRETDEFKRGIITLAIALGCEVEK